MSVGGGGVGTYLRIPLTTGAPEFKPGVSRSVVDKDEEPRKRKVRTQGAPRPRPQAERRKAPPPPARPKPAPPAIPLPEEFWQSRTGKVYRKNREYTICPRCKENWKTAVSAVCQPCADVDGTRQKAAAKRLGTLAQKKKEERSHE